MSLCLWHVWISVTTLSDQSPAFAQLIILSSSNHFFPYISGIFHLSSSQMATSQTLLLVEFPQSSDFSLLFDVYNHSLSHLSSLHGLFSFTWLSLWPFHPSSCSGRKSFFFFFLVLIDLFHLLKLALSKSCQLFLNVYLVSDHSKLLSPYSIACLDDCNSFPIGTCFHLFKYGTPNEPVSQVMALMYVKFCNGPFFI